MSEKMYLVIGEEGGGSDVEKRGSNGRIRKSCVRIATHRNTYDTYDTILLVG